MGIMRMNRVLNAWMRLLCEVMMGIDEKIDESGLATMREWGMGYLWESVWEVA